jgi:hypothetical protein
MISGYGDLDKAKIYSACLISTSCIGFFSQNKSTVEIIFHTQNNSSVQMIYRELFSGALYYDILVLKKDYSIQSSNGLD